MNSADVIHWVRETGSTNADMMQLATNGADEGNWVCAKHQTAGRGRLGRQWASAGGNFFGSTLVRLHPTDPAPATLAMVTAVALFDVIASALPVSTALRIKWPNDVLLGGAKVSGILLERGSAGAAQNAVVIGIGVNLVHAPAVPGRETTSIADHGGAIHSEDFAQRLLIAMADAVRNWRGIDGLQLLHIKWQDRAHAAGTPLHVTLADGTAVAGTYDGLAADGALRLRDGGGSSIVIHAGDVALL